MDDGWMQAAASDRLWIAGYSRRRAANGEWRHGWEEGLMRVVIPSVLPRVRNFPVVDGALHLVREMRTKPVGPTKTPILHEAARQ
jgi:hypothetical protein